MEHGENDDVHFSNNEVDTVGESPGNSTPNFPMDQLVPVRIQGNVFKSGIYGFDKIQPQSESLLLIPGVGECDVLFCQRLDPNWFGSCAAEDPGADIGPGVAICAISFPNVQACVKLFAMPRIERQGDAAL